MKSNKILGISLILGALLLFVNVLGISHLSDNIIYGCTLLLYGILTVYFNFGSGKKGRIFLGAVLFLTGILLFISGLYTIIEKDHLFMMVFLFVLGAGFLMLYLDNSHEKSFLISGALLILFSVFTKDIVSLLGNFSLIANIGFILMGYWPVFLILFGAAILISREKY